MKTVKNLISIACLATLAGMMIGTGCICSLYANNITAGTDWAFFGKLTGAILFSMGMFMVLTYRLKLFTGMVASLIDTKVSEWYTLVVAFLFNSLGIGIMAALSSNTAIGDLLVAQSQSVVAAKLAAEGWAVKVLLSSILCGLMITISVWSIQHAPTRSLAATVGVMMPIIVFVFMGWDHSVANMFYIFLNGTFSWSIVALALIAIVGNVIGGVFMPVLFRVKNWAEAKDGE